MSLKMGCILQKIFVLLDILKLFQERLVIKIGKKCMIGVGKILEENIPGAAVIFSLSTSMIG